MGEHRMAKLGPPTPREVVSCQLSVASGGGGENWQLTTGNSSLPSPSGGGAGLGKAAALMAGLAVTLGVLPAAGKEVKHRSGPVHIGMVGTLFRDTPQPLVMALMQPFGALMESQTGLRGQLIPGSDAASLAQQLADDKLQLAVLHGIEFGWARQLHPELRALMIAVSQDRHLRAHLVVRASSKVADIGDLQGQCLALPRGIREHCHIFLQARCQECGKEPGQLFRRITTPPNVEEALDDVVDDQVQAAVVDSIGLECFKRRKPGRFASLKILLTSEVFPAAVVAYRDGAIEDETLQRFREGMINANKTAIGRQLMTLWKLTSFEPVPDDYEDTLTDIIKAYPAPPAGSK